LTDVMGCIATVFDKCVATGGGRDFFDKKPEGKSVERVNV